jgi:hypothetical protein
MSLSEIKACANCYVKKPFTEEYFTPDVSRLGVPRLRGVCRECRAASRRQARAAEPEKAARQSREQGRRWREKNPDRAAQHRKKWAVNNRDSVLALTKDWQARNRERYLAMRKSSKARMSLGQRFKETFSSGISHSLAGRKNGRKWQSLVGYDIVQLRSHLERQFQEGMSWNNYGQWHVDHIIPVSSFSFSDAEDDDFKRCWSLANLRPLWASENMRKGKKRVFLL